MAKKKRMLGALPPREDHRTLRLSAYLDRAALPPVPASTNYRSKVPSWGVMLNDTIGCCAIAGPGHNIQTWTANVGPMYVPADADILTAYKACSGYDGTPATDKGCVVLDVYNYWRSKGISGHKLGAYAALHLGNHAEVQQSVYFFDGVGVGIQLPKAWQNATKWQAPTTANPPAAWAPGSWGGHYVPILDFDANWLYVLSWGMVIPMSWHAYDTYVVESYALFSQDWFNGANVAPNGFDLWALAQDLQDITGTVVPVPPKPSPTPPAPPPPVGAGLTFTMFPDKKTVTVPAGWTLN